MKVVFVCHGNICRSVMAEYIFKNMCKIDNVVIYSRATSTEEIGNDIYPYAKDTLDRHNISYQRHYARQITKKEFDEADLIIIMDNNNYRNITRMYGNSPKIHFLKEYSIGYGEISDPWYTGRFEDVYNEITDGCKGLLKIISQ